LHNRGFDFSILHALDALIIAAAGDPIPITALGHEPQNVRSDLKHGYERLAQKQARPSKPHARFEGKMSVEQQEIFFVRRTFEMDFEKLADAGVAVVGGGRERGRAGGREGGGRGEIVLVEGDKEVGR